MYLDHCDYWSKGGANQLQGVCKCRKCPIAWCWQIWSAVSGVFAEKIWGSWLSTNQNINREWKVKHTLVAMLKKFELRLCKRYIRKMCPASKGRCHLRFSGIRPLRGYTPPPPLTENQSEKKKVFFLSGKGGDPHPPLNGKSAMLFREIFS